MLVKPGTTELYRNIYDVKDYVDIPFEDFKKLCNFEMIWQGDKVIPNPYYREGDASSVITIGVTGSYGKTSTCEIIYQYLLAKGKNVMLISTNGIFVNNRTIRKDFMETTPGQYYMREMIQHAYNWNQIDYAVVELAAESVKEAYSFDIDFTNTFDIVGLTNFRETLVNNFNGDVNFYKHCKEKLLHAGNKAVVPTSLAEDFYHTNTYDYLESFGNYSPVQVKNISLAIALLSELNLYEGETAEDFPPITLRGRNEIFDNIVVDTGWCGYENLLQNLKEQLGNSIKVRLIYVPIWYGDENSTVVNYRDAAKAALSTCVHIYITHAVNEKDFELNKNKFLPENYTNYEYIYDYEDVVDKAVADCASDEIIVIMTREHYREFRNYVKQIKNLE